MNYVISYPKTGRTWLRFTLGKYFEKSKKTEHPTNFNTIASVFYDHVEHPRPAEYSDYPEIMFAHTLPENIDTGDGKILIVVRHVLDTLISFAHHLHGELNDRSKMEFLVSENISDLVRYYNAWAHYRSKVKVIEYSQIDDMLRICWAVEYLTGESADESLVREAIMESSFGNMKADEDEHRNLTNQKAGRRVRKGKHHGYKDVLKPEEIERIYDKLKEGLSNDAIGWLMTYRCI